MSHRLTILCASGTVLEKPESLRTLIKDFSAIKGGKLLVHGGGEMAATFAQKMGIKIRNASDGKPIVSDKLIDVLTMVHGGLINKRLVALLQRAGINAVGLTGADMNLLVASLADSGHGWLGEVKKVNTPLLQQLLERNIVPVLSPIAYDLKAQAHYVSEIEIAQVVARVLSLSRSVTIIYLSDRNGVLMNDNDPDSVIASLSRSRYKNMKEMGLLKGDITGFLDAAFTSIDHGVSRIYITSVERLGNLEQATVIK